MLSCANCDAMLSSHLVVAAADLEREVEGRMRTATIVKSPSPSPSRCKAQNR